MSDDKATPNGDYSARMRAVIDAEADPVREPYEARIAASAIVEKLRENDPELLRGWLDAQAEQLVWRFIVDRDCQLRAHERKDGVPVGVPEERRAVRGRRVRGDDVVAGRAVHGRGQRPEEPGCLDEG